jgi:hypothetical protein
MFNSLFTPGSPGLRIHKIIVDGNDEEKLENDGTTPERLLFIEQSFCLLMIPDISTRSEVLSSMPFQWHPRAYPFNDSQLLIQGVTCLFEATSDISPALLRCRGTRPTRVPLTIYILNFKILKSIS